MSDEKMLEVSARSVSAPSDLNSEARAQLAQGAPSNSAWPTRDDMPGWRDLIVGMNKMGEAGFDVVSQLIAAEVEAIAADGARVWSR